MLSAILLQVVYKTTCNVSKKLVILRYYRLIWIKSINALVLHIIQKYSQTHISLNGILITSRTDE